MSLISKYRDEDHSHDFFKVLNFFEHSLTNYKEFIMSEKRKAATAVKDLQRMKASTQREGWSTWSEVHITNDKIQDVKELDIKPVNVDHNIRAVKELQGFVSKDTAVALRSGSWSTMSNVHVTNDALAVDSKA